MIFIFYERHLRVNKNSIQCNINDINELRTLFNSFSKELKYKFNAFNHSLFKSLITHSILRAFITVILKSHANMFQLFWNFQKYLFSGISYTIGHLFQKLFWVYVMLALMIRAKMILIPCFWVSTITTATHISFQLDSMTCMISLFKAVLTNYTCLVFFTIHAPPGYISWMKLLCTNSFRGILTYMIYDFSVFIFWRGSKYWDKTFVQREFLLFDYFIFCFSFSIFSCQYM